MVGSFGGPGPTAALTSPAQLAPPRRTQVAHNQRDAAVSVGSMLVAGNTKVTDLLCVTPPPIPPGALAMTQLVELPPRMPDQGHTDIRDRYSVTYCRAESSLSSRDKPPLKLLRVRLFGNQAATWCTIR